MNTITLSYTKTDIRQVFENLQADLQMLAIRTQAMDSDHAKKCAYDILQMAFAGCLKHVHLQLYDSLGHLKKVHRFSVKEVVLSESQRPGGNRWPCLPDGSLELIVEYSDNQAAEKLKNSGNLLLNWSSTDLSTDYTGMRRDSNRLYSSNGYGLQRDTFTN